MIDLDGLNELQREAVIHMDGPCLVIAGAGSGKTKVLTTRIAYLSSEGVPSYQILAITFTNKAAKEMKERLLKVDPFNEAFVGTFHSFGVRVLKENIEALGLSKNFVILDSDDQRMLIKKIIKDKGYDPKEVNPYFVASRISFIKNEMLSIEEARRFMNSSNEEIAIEVYEEYIKILKQNDTVDFDDLLCLPVKLFETRPDLLEKYQKHYKYILIDEYQDTNEVQYKLVKLLASRSKNIFVVGDPDQSIYQFRGANYKNILNFESDYKNAKVIPLEDNYRSTKMILDAANAVIKNNTDRKEKNLRSHNGEGVKTKYIRAFDEKDEIKKVLDEVKKLYNEGYENKDMAIFYRTNAQSRVLEEGFLKENIPYKVIGSYYFYKRAEIKDLISYLRLVQNYKDDISLRRVINSPKRGIGTTSIEKLEQRALFNGTSLYEALETSKELEFKKVIEELSNDMIDMSLTEFVEDVINKSGLKSALEAENTLESQSKIENLMEFKSIAKNFEDETGSVDLRDFLENISLIADMSEHEDDGNVVTLMTLHSAKGLEFPIVFMVGMEEGIFPHSNSFNEEGGIEEERRLCYVGITRAKKKLYLLNAKQRMMYGQRQITDPSRFISEIPDDLLEKEEIKPMEFSHKINTSSMYNSDSEVDYKVGDRVSHTMYGVGIVVGIEDDIITIAFHKRFGIRKLLKNHKNLRKL